METYIPISYLNDFIFCPRSIYNHQLYFNRDEIVYQGEVQVKGKWAHETIDKKSYSDKKNVLQNFEVYSKKYGLFGKIDLFDVDKGLLSERKNNIQVIYDGYVFQLYAQYFGLTEMGFCVNQICLYDFSKNKVHPIKIPNEDQAMFEKFEATIIKLKRYSLLQTEFTANPAKCMNCIYNLFCDASLC